jgi:hypothetical protein
VPTIRHRVSAPNPQTAPLRDIYRPDGTLDEAAMRARDHEIGAEWARAHRVIRKKDCLAVWAERGESMDVLTGCKDNVLPEQPGWHTSGRFVGFVLGVFLASMFIPVILLIVFGLTPLKRKPKISHGVAGVLAIATAFAAAGGGGDPLASVLAAILAAAVFWWGYARAKRRLTVPSITKNGAAAH